MAIGLPRETMLPASTFCNKPVPTKIADRENYAQKNPTGDYAQKNPTVD